MTKQNEINTCYYKELWGTQSTKHQQRRSMCQQCQVQLKNTHKYKGKAVQDGNETALGTLSAFT